MAISTPTLKFLDIRNFIAAGFSYTKYPAVYEFEEQKDFFPYEYILVTSLRNSTRRVYLPVKHFTVPCATLIYLIRYLCQVWRGNGMTSLRVC